MATKQNGDACCGDGDHQHSHDHDHDHYDVDVMNDPTLMSCCEKDQVAYDRAMALKRVLTAHDPSTQNVRMRQQVVALPPVQPHTSVATTGSAQAQAAAAIAHKLRALEVQSDSDDDSDLDLDDDLDALFASRRLELAAQFEAAARNAADGYGIILETDLPTLLKELGATPAIPRVAFVCSASVEAGIARDMHTQILSLANRFVGTKFYAITTTSQDEDAMRQLRITTAPTLVAFRRGQRIDAAAIQEKELVATSVAVLWEARLVPWLTMCNVLETTRETTSAGSRQGGAGRRGDTDGDAEGDGEVVAFDCGVGGCRIRFAYEHEHVGPSKETKTEISAWRTSPGEQLI